MLNRDHLPLPLPEKRHCCQVPTQKFKARNTEKGDIRIQNTYWTVREETYTWRTNCMPISKKIPIQYYPLLKFRKIIGQYTPTVFICVPVGKGH
jgi:hypothetical protein